MFKAVNDAVAAAPRKRLLIHSLDVKPEISSGSLGPGLARYAEQMKFPTTLDVGQFIALGHSEARAESKSVVFVSVRLVTW